MSDLKPTKLVRIEGGPSLLHVRVTDAETGREIYVSGIRFNPVNWGAKARPLTVWLEVPAELRIVAEAAEVSPGEVFDAVAYAAALKSGAFVELAPQSQQAKASAE